MLVQITAVMEVITWIQPAIFFRKIHFPAGQEQFQDKRVTAWHKTFAGVYLHLQVLALFVFAGINF